MSPSYDNFPRTFSLIISFGGLKSAREIGLKEIQKLAISGISTIERTKKMVGNKSRKASLFSFLNRALLLFRTILFLIFRDLSELNSQTTL